MQATHYFKNHSKIASFIGAIFIGLACFGAAQTAQAKTPTLPLQASIQEQKTQIQPASSEWQMPMDVTTVPNAGRVQEQGKVEVVEFFWYGCPHCADFEPAIAQWRAAQSSEVKIITVPVSWNQPMVVHQRIYFALEALNRLDLHDRVFKDVAALKGHLATPELASAWAQKQGISSAQWRAAFSSAAVTKKIQFAQEQFDRFGLTGVPAVVVDGRYQVLLSPNTIQTLDALVKQRLLQASQTSQVSQTPPTK